MKITIWGNHTAEYGDFPYEKGRQFERALKSHWDAISYFNFNCIDGADVFLTSEKLADMTVRQVYVKLTLVIKAAGTECNWDIWSCNTL